jgi:hypothetical protein
MTEPKTFAQAAVWGDGFQKGLNAATEMLELAKADERNRIIELLTDFDNEKYYEWLKSDDQAWPDYAQTAIGLRLAIALIKGAK